MLVTTQWPLEHAVLLTSLVWVCVLWLPWKLNGAICAMVRDLIAATGLVILLKLNSNRRFFSLCDLEIWWMTLKNDRAPLLYYIKLCASFEIHRWIQPGLNYSPETLNSGQNRQCLVPCDLEIWWMILKNNRAPLLCYVKLCASFQSHRWIQT